MFDKPEWELVVFMIVYAIFHMVVIDPIYGMTIGVGEPILSMIRDANHRTAWSTNLRTWILIFSTVILSYIYVYVRPRLAGEDPEEFWSGERGKW